MELSPSQDPVSRTQQIKFRLSPPSIITSRPIHQRVFALGWTGKTKHKQCPATPVAPFVALIDRHGLDKHRLCRMWDSTARLDFALSLTFIEFVFPYLFPRRSSADRLIGYQHLRNSQLKPRNRSLGDHTAGYWFVWVCRLGIRRPDLSNAAADGAATVAERLKRFSELPTKRHSKAPRALCPLTLRTINHEFASRSKLISALPAAATWRHARMPFSRRHCGAAPDRDLRHEWRSARRPPPNPSQAQW